MKKIRIIAIIFVFLYIVKIFVNGSVESQIYAASAGIGEETTTTTAEDNSITNNIFDKGGSFFNKSKNEYTKDDSSNNMVEELRTQLLSGTDSIYGIIKTLGYLVFGFVTIVLGLKYIWSGVDEKSRIKETLPVLIAGALFFFLAQGILDLVTGDFGFITEASLDEITGSAFKTLKVVANFVAIAGLVFVGLQYMMSSADKKADIKTKMFPIVIGLVFVFCSVQVLSLIIDSGESILNTGGDVNYETSTNINSATEGQELASISTIFKNLWANVIPVVQVLAILTIVISGIRYMLSPADAKSEIKQSTTNLLIGAILVFSAVSVAQFIVSAAKEIIP